MHKSCNLYKTVPNFREIDWCNLGLLQKEKGAIAPLESSSLKITLESGTPALRESFLN